MGSPTSIADRPLIPEPVPPMSVLDHAVICDDGEICVVEHRHLDVDDAHLPLSVARVVVLDVIVPAIHSWGALRLNVADGVTVPLFHAVEGGGCPTWSCPCCPGFRRMRATNRRLALEALVEHLGRWHAHTPGVAA